MVAKIGVVALAMLATLSSVAYAGVEPSPFKRRELPGVVEQIAVRLDVIPTWDVDRETLRQTSELRSQLMTLKESIAETSRFKSVGNLIEIMNTVSSGMLGSRPSPQALQATLDVLGRLSAVAFNPQPEPPAHLSQAITIMDRIVAVAFNPQPEPPARETGIAILDKVAAVAFNPQPEPPAVGQMLDVLDNISAVLFNPQPEPPARGTVAAMLDAISLMGRLQAPVR
jgi:hypothetical protein